MVSLERLRALSEQTGFQESILEKVILLEEILADIAKHPLLSRVLALKGGTALNLGFGPPSRLSVDLDFNYIGSLDRPSMEADRGEVERAIQQIATSKKYRIQWSREAHAGRKCFLNYQSALGTPERIEVDLNFLHRQMLFPLERRSLWYPDAKQRTDVTMMSLPELCAGKLCALLDRAAPRDLYDAGRLPDFVGQEWHTKNFRSVVIGLSGMLPRSIHEYGPEHLDRFGQDAVEKNLYPVLIFGDRPSLVDLKAKAWKAIAPFTILSQEEAEFVNALQKGTLVPEKLFPHDTQLRERLLTHPILLWKAKNAREHVRKKK